MNYAASSLTPIAQLREMNEGLAFIRRVKAIAETSQFEPLLLDTMKDMDGHLLAKDNMRHILKSLPFNMSIHL